MPYKFETDKRKIPRELDRRVKLSLEDREKIKEYYGKISQRKLAKLFGVSRRLIQFIGDPEQYEKNKGIRRYYYDKDKHREYMKNHRRWKKQLNDKGKLEGKWKN